MRRGIIFIVALLSLFSCGREYKEVMDTAEAQMMQKQVLSGYQRRHHYPDVL